MQDEFLFKDSRIEELEQKVRCYKNKYMEWKETCMYLTNNRHREAWELALATEPESLLTSTGESRPESPPNLLITRLPLSLRTQIGEAIYREYIAAGGVYSGGDEEGAAAGAAADAEEGPGAAAGAEEGAGAASA